MKKVFAFIILLVMACTMIPSAFCEESPVTYSLAIEAFDTHTMFPIYYPLEKFYSEKVIEAGATPDYPQSETNKHIWYVYGDGGELFYAFTFGIYTADAIFFHDACFIEEDKENLVLDMPLEKWTNCFIRQVKGGADVYFYLSSSAPETDNELLMNTQALADTLLNGDFVLDEAENKYILNGFDGALHLIYLDKVEDYTEGTETWEYVFDQMLDYMGLDTNVQTLLRQYDDLL